MLGTRYLGMTISPFVLERDVYSVAAAEQELYKEDGMTESDIRNVFTGLPHSGRSLEGWVARNEDQDLCGYMLLIRSPRHYDVLAEGIMKSYEGTGLFRQMYDMVKLRLTPNGPRAIRILLAESDGLEEGQCRDLAMLGFVSAGYGVNNRIVMIYNYHPEVDGKMRAFKSYCTTLRASRRAIKAAEKANEGKADSD